MVTQQAGSFFAWIDYSEQERRKALDVLELFRERETRDELGIGTIRDAFADLLFQGTSTIQTRAKYFLLVPWTYLEMERLRVPSSQVADHARKEEVRLIQALLDTGESEGVIGKDVRAGLKRLPSSIYWLGLRTWGIRRFPGSQAQYHRSLDRFYRWDPRSNPQVRNDDGEPLDGTLPVNWDTGIPPRPRDFPRHSSLRLSRSEATYLQERILTSAGGTLLAFLVESARASKQVPLPWFHPCRPELPERLGEQLLHAQNFSEAMHGSALLYNLMLAKLQDHQDLIGGYRDKLKTWSQLLTSRAKDMSRWDRSRFWTVVHSGGARVPLGARAFVDQWLDLVLGDGNVGRRAAGMPENESARRLISYRERAIKGERARLHNRRALELWSGAAGAAQLSFRWPVAQQIILDIIEGLAGDGVDA